MAGAGRRVALVGGGEALRALARAARDLKAGKRSAHPELNLFDSWGELQEYAAYDPPGRDLLPLADLVDGHGVDVILDAVDELSVEQGAEIVVSTAHKAKGREWLPSASARTSPSRWTRKRRTRTVTPSPAASTTPKPASPMSPSPATNSTSVAWAGINQLPDGNPGATHRRQDREPPSPWDTWGSAPN